MRSVQLGAFSLLLAGGRVSATEEDSREDRYYKIWRKDPKMVVFGDSTSDSGRRFNAPASFDFEDIGPFPFKKLFEESNSEEKFKVYTPSVGAATNGKVWADWLRVPEEYNFATSSATASEAFRSLESCLGYTGDGEDYPTGTLAEQIALYFHDVVDQTTETLDYTHVILLGGNDFVHAAEAIFRYLAGGASHVDPIPRDLLFDASGAINLEPVITAVLEALAEGITTLVSRGVTGRVLVGNIASPRGVPDSVGSENVDFFETFALAMRAGIITALEDFLANEDIDANIRAQLSIQLRLLDVYTLFAAIADDEEVFTDEGFAVGTGEGLGSPCLEWNFRVDDTAEILGTQGDRAEGCQDEKCALCADGNSPCQTCLEGNPSATLCEDDPHTRLFWDARHPTTAFHRLFGEAVRQCAKDQPDRSRAWVSQLCPEAGLTQL